MLFTYHSLHCVYHQYNALHYTTSRPYITYHGLHCLSIITLVIFIVIFILLYITCLLSNYFSSITSLVAHCKISTPLHHLYRPLQYVCFITSLIAHHLTSHALHLLSTISLNVIHYIMSHLLHSFYSITYHTSHYSSSVALLITHYTTYHPLYLFLPFYVRLIDVFGPIPTSPDGSVGRASASGLPDPGSDLGRVRPNTLIAVSVPYFMPHVVSITSLV